MNGDFKPAKHSLAIARNLAANVVFNQPRAVYDPCIGDRFVDKVGYLHAKKNRIENHAFCRVAKCDPSFAVIFAGTT